MTKLEIDILNSMDAQKKVSKVYLLTLIASIVPFLFIEWLTPSFGESALFFQDRIFDNFGFYGILVSVTMVTLLLLIIVVIHELIHGLFFKLFAPNSRVKFGFKSGMAYASSPGSIFSRGEFIIILLAPFVIITLIGITLMVFYPHGSYKYILILHTAACAGDFYFAFIIFANKHLTYCEDTEVGITLYSEDPTSS